METTEVREQVRVLAAFAGGTVRPVRFKWRERSYAVTGVNGQWRERQEEAEVWHFSVEAAGGTWFLHVSCRDWIWWLDEVVAAEG